jgi:hypothetical protein
VRREELQGRLILQLLSREAHRQGHRGGEGKACQGWDARQDRDGKRVEEQRLQEPEVRVGPYRRQQHVQQLAAVPLGGEEVPHGGVGDGPDQEGVRQLERPPTDKAGAVGAARDPDGQPGQEHEQRHPHEVGGREPPVQVLRRRDAGQHHPEVDVVGDDGDDGQATRGI